MKHETLWTTRWLRSISEIDPAQWDKLALPLATPLLEWQWLHQLEASGSISPRYGWQPHHLTLWDGQELIGAAPLYIKNHSGGEFVFDHWWHQLAEEQGSSYYPKMVGMSPATPSVGYRFLTAKGRDESQVVHAMLGAIDQQCQKLSIAACQFNFVDTEWFNRYSQHGFTGWQHQSYLWQNADFNDFNDYLLAFNSSQRRNIKRECNSMKKLGIEIRALTGDAIPIDLAQIMYRYYLNTNEKFGPWAARFVNGDFFERLFLHYRHRLLIICAYTSQSATPIAMSMLLTKGRHLIGRYWGCDTPRKDLHFNMCYYAPIKWAIENGIQTFDPGAGSPHKILRGFEAVANTSLHSFYNQHMNDMFKKLIPEVNSMERANIRTLNTKLPFSRKN